MKKKPPTQHVVRNSNGGWAVKKGGAFRATKVYSTQKEAVMAGREIAKKQSAEFYIHGIDGRIQEKDSYGRDSNPHQVKR